MFWMVLWWYFLPSFEQKVTFSTEGAKTLSKFLFKNLKWFNRFPDAGSFLYWYGSLKFAILLVKVQYILSFTLKLISNFKEQISLYIVNWGNTESYWSHWSYSNFWEWVLVVIFYPFIEKVTSTFSWTLSTCCFKFVLLKYAFLQWSHL